MNIFGRIQNGIMTINTFGNIIKEEWEKTPCIRKNIALGEYIIMPNHFHGIIEILEKITTRTDELGESQFAPTTFKAPSQNIGAIIRGFKGASTKKVKNLIHNTAARANCNSLQQVSTIDLSKSIWQRNYYEHIIKNDSAYQNISNYIINNPKKWKEDAFYKSK